MLSDWYFAEIYTGNETERIEEAEPKLLLLQTRNDLYCGRMPSTNNRFLKWVCYGRNFGEVLTTHVWIIEKLTVVEMANEREILHGIVTLSKVLTGLLTVRVVRIGSGRGKWSLGDGKLSRTTKNCLIIKGAWWLGGDGGRRLEMFQLSGIMEGKRWRLDISLPLFS